MPLFKAKEKDKKKNGSLGSMVEDLQRRQTQLVEAFGQDQGQSSERISKALSDLESYVVKLDAVVSRLENVADTLVEENDARIKPWYIRIFCP